MPHKTATKPKPLYRRKLPAHKESPDTQEHGRAALPRRRQEKIEASAAQQRSPTATPDADFTHAKPVPISHFELREDGSIQIGHGRAALSERAAPELIFSHDSPFVRLYHADCLSLLDAIAAKYPEGRFDAIFADPPYFLSNGGITCHAGRMVKVDKGDWDKSRGPELNHEFNLEWLRRCRNVLKPNGTIWVSGTHHVIFSIGYAMQQLGYKILNDIAWEKPNPPPNLSCRYFTHSTETILWAARDEKSKHVFNYQDMRKVTGKQMKTVWRDVRGEEFKVGQGPPGTPGHRGNNSEDEEAARSENVALPPESIWTINAPTTSEKTHGKHPTQKTVALIERCLLASTHPGDLVLDPFLGGGTTAIAALKLNRGCVGIELDFTHLTLAAKRADKGIISIWLRHFRMTVSVMIYGRAALPRRRPSENPEGIQSFSPALAVKRPTLGNDPPNTSNSEGVESKIAAQKDLDLFWNSINGSRVDDKPQVPTERIFHECKFVFLSCAEVERGAVVHTTVDVSLQEAWAKTPNGKKRETTHVVRCETEIFRVR